MSESIRIADVTLEYGDDNNIHIKAPPYGATLTFLEVETLASRLASLAHRKFGIERGWCTRCGAECDVCVC